jgi:beta-glucosidase
MHFSSFKNRLASAIKEALLTVFLIAACAPGLLHAMETTVTASSTLSGSPEAILDGEPSSWSANGGKQILTLDLHYPVTIRSVGIYWKKMASRYEILTSTDGRKFKPVFSGKNMKPKGRREGGHLIHYLDQPVTARYIRIRCIEPVKQNGNYEIVNIEINGSAPLCFEPVPADAICRDPNASAEARVDDLLARMTVSEKIRMMGGFQHFFFPGNDRFGLAQVLLNDATSGLHLRPEVEGEYSSITESTSFPLATALAATWQPELAEAMGRAIGEECRAAGTGVLLGPGVNIHRTSTGGRNFEYMSEDPYLTSRMAVGHIIGVQQMGIVATVKHFIANSHEFMRHDSNALIDERTLNEIYLPAFRAAVQEADVKAVMSAYNWLNGTKCGEHRVLLTDILRDQLGYTGMVMSDWGGTANMDKVLDSGQNIVMPNMKNLGEIVRAELARGDKVAVEARINTMIRPTFKVLFEMGTWDRPAADPAFNATFEAHKIVARTIGEAAITLLKNEQVLPLKKTDSILVIGDELAVLDAASGGGSGKVTGYDAINYLEGLKTVFGPQVTYETDPDAKTIRQADRILYFFNTPDREGRDHPFELPNDINKQITALAEANPNVIVIATSGTAFGMPWLKEVQGLVHCYYLGQERGNALANVLSGAVTPSGKLPFSMERSFSDSPSFDYNILNGEVAWGQKNKKPKAQVDIPYKEGVFVGYRWYESNKKPVNFPFGFGLSYTTFSISDATLSSIEMSKETPITVTITVTNTGKTQGAEVVQLYVHEDKPRVERPYRELKAFQKVFLEPGESKEVELTLNWESLAFWDVNTHDWAVNPGTFTLLIGNSAQNVQCQQSIRFSE